MLVQKSSLNKRTKIMLVVLIVCAVLGGGYFVYNKFIDGQNGNSANTSITITDQSLSKLSVTNINTGIFSDPKLLQFKDNKFAGFTDQYSGIVLDGKKPMPPSEVTVYNPATGKKLVISWRLPDYINFNKVRVYRLSSNGDSQLAANLDVDAQQKVMSYLDSGLENNMTYNYLIRTAVQPAKDAPSQNDYESENVALTSGMPTDIVAPEQPLGVTVKSTDSGTMLITWINPPDKDFATVRIYRSAQAGQLGALIYPNSASTPSTSATSYEDKDIAANVAYFYTVTSVDASANESSKDLKVAPQKNALYNPFEPISF